MKRQRAERRGRRAETIAVWWLRLQGWRILARRMRTPRGEIDIVARRGRTLVFVEVKARENDGALSLSIDQWRLLRVAAAADVLIPRFARAEDDIRIDVILIAPRRLPIHLKNVWHG